MNRFSEQDYKKLISMLNDIEELANRFYSLTCEQTEILQSGSMERLDNNITERQGIIDSINVLYREADSLLDTYGLEITLDDPELRQVAALREHIRDKLDQARAVNEKNEELAYRKRDELGAEVGRISMSHKSIRAYNQNMMPAEPVHYDKKE